MYALFFQCRVFSREKKHQQAINGPSTYQRANGFLQPRSLCSMSVGPIMSRRQTLQARSASMKAISITISAPRKRLSLRSSRGSRPMPWLWSRMLTARMRRRRRPMPVSAALVFARMGLSFPVSRPCRPRLFGSGARPARASDQRHHAPCRWRYRLAYGKGGSGRNSTRRQASRSDKLWIVSTYWRPISTFRKVLPSSDRSSWTGGCSRSQACSDPISPRTRKTSWKPCWWGAIVSFDSQTA